MTRGPQYSWRASLASTAGKPKHFDAQDEYQMTDHLKRFAKVEEDSTKTAASGPTILSFQLLSPGSIQGRLGPLAPKVGLATTSRVRLPALHQTVVLLAPKL